MDAKHKLKFCLFVKHEKGEDDGLQVESTKIIQMSLVNEWMDWEDNILFINMNLLVCISRCLQSTNWHTQLFSCINSELLRMESTICSKSNAMTSNWVPSSRIAHGVHVLNFA